MDSTLAKASMGGTDAAGPATHTAYRPDIDGLRAIAVVAVLIFHAFPAYLRGGFAGVDVFFVISGFLISGGIGSALGKSRFSFVDFYSRRIRRIFPALILVIATCLAFGWRSMISDDFTLLARDVVGGSSFSSNLFYWNEAGYFAQTATSKPLLHLWSLGIEEQFYIFWPIILYFAASRRIPAIRPILLILIVSFLVNVLWIRADSVAMFYSPISRAWELALGACIAYIVNHRVAPCTRVRWSSVASIFGIFLIAVSMGLLDESDVFPGWWAVCPTVGTAFLLFSTPSGYINRVLLGNPFVTQIGRISYPLYLWHWPLLVFARNSSPEDLSTTERIGVVLVSALLAVLTVRFIEQPIRNGNHPALKSSILAACMAVLCLIGIYAWRSHGVPSPYPESIQELTRYELDSFRTNIRRGQCFLEADGGLQFPSECVDAGTSPLWAIWGDSGAAALYQGFRTFASTHRDMRLAQFTRSQCPPILNVQSYPKCVGGNEVVLTELARVHPDVVVLSAVWGKYKRDGVGATLSALKKLGVKRIIVLGPTPVWTDSPARLLLIQWKADIAHRVPPSRLSYARYALDHDLAPGAAIDMRTSTADSELRAVASEFGVEYIDPSRALCNAHGCLTRASDESRDPFYLDVSHLNKRGADYVVARIADKLIGASQ